MTDLTLELVAERMTRLERQNCRLKAAAVVVAALLAAAVAWGAHTAAPEVVEAQRFVLVSADGEQLAQLAGGEQGGAVLALYDKGAAQPRVSLGIGQEAGLWIYDKDGKTKRAVLSLGETPELSLYGTDGQQNVELGVDKAHDPFLNMIGWTGEATAANANGFSLDVEDGRAALGMLAAGKTLVDLHAMSEQAVKKSLLPPLPADVQPQAAGNLPAAALTLQDAEGHSRGYFGVAVDGSPSIQLHDAKGNDVFSKP
jgi:hypothetical protein